MIQSLPGFREFYPESCAERNHIFRIWTQVVRRFGFVEVYAPVLEPLELFTEKSGPEIVKQLFHFEDQGGRKVALRPEMTPSVARLVGAKAQSLKKPMKWFSVGEFFRYERPQKGRLRSFYQLNVDMFGEESVQADAEVIACLVQTLQAFGLTDQDFCLKISDRTLWLSYLTAKGLDAAQSEAVLRVIDKLDTTLTEGQHKELEAIFGERTQGFCDDIQELMRVKSLQELKAFFAGQAALHEAIQKRLDEWQVLMDTLGALDVALCVQVDCAIVRGLAYYTGFVFEVFEKSGKGRALAGGGRYDDLIQKLGGPSMPAVGFAIGDVTLLDLLKEKSLMPAYIQKPDVYVVMEDAANVRAEALKAVSRLRAQGHSVEYGLKLTTVAKQMKAAHASGAGHIWIYEQADVVDGYCKRYNPATKTQERMALSDRYLDM